MNTKPSIKASSLVLLLVMSLAPSLVPSLVIATDEMTDSSKAPNISNSMELPATPAEIPAATQTITPSKSVNPAEIVNSGEAQTNNAAPNPSNCQSDNRATGGSGDAQVNKGQVSSGQVDNNWMKPLAAEFAKLDKTGNGLVIPSEATRGKAFNKKSFAKADTDKYGSIDQNEYINFKGGDSSKSMS